MEHINLNIGGASPFGDDGRHAVHVVSDGAGPGVPPHGQVGGGSVQAS